MDAMKDRLELAGIGAVAGYCLWGLFENLPHVVGEGFLLLALTVGASVFFAVLMALVGPERPLRAVLPSLALGGVTGALALWAGLRFESVSAFYDAGHPLMALFVIALIGAPFAAAALEEKDGWRDYARLFDCAWGIFIRYVAGWLFAGLIFLVLLLSDELLKLVGIRAIGDLLDVDWLRYTIVGAVFGLGVATVHELRDYVSPVLVHRLLRMLLPLVLVVVIVFIGALPFRGLSDLFGKLSTGGVLMAVAFAGITLITTAIDRDDESAAQMKLMTVSARLMALLLPVLVGLAVYAIWLRVAAYGWTPQRVIAAYIALFLLGYVVSYLWAVVSRWDWQERLRQSNLYMALGVCVGGLFWLTPVMNAEAISANNQLARFQSGKTKLDDVPAYEMAHDWGVAGRVALEALAAGGDEQVLARVKAAKEAGSRWAFERDEKGESLADMRLEMSDRVATVAGGGDFAPVLEVMERNVLEQIGRECPAGSMPSCVFLDVSAGADPLWRSMGALVTREDNQVYEIKTQSSRAYIYRSDSYNSDGLKQRAPDDLFERIMAGDFELTPITRNVLKVGDAVFIPYN
ncbi:DUF4153 domain-containing protein [Lentibacter sp. XHP0401]|jgi:Domain of unknown function (DUF4153)|uniref:DUF4153 domain-containing protein n=1 Tax=Lentibacter sp. XHP0401 TaxID=2984334 RepID=UPI0021E960A2|nr:DUF4153 domain-containing protein [Lentibacter sp. XHP0401]MCV2892964.1 DUF4153 domain-containing protein [Lentibacter sp. XHP0401]